MARTVFVPSPGGGETFLVGWTAVVPSLGIGNVCQLAVDAIVNSVLNGRFAGASAVKLGFLRSACLAPCVGGPAFDVTDAPWDVTTGVDVLAVPAWRVVFVQQRVPALPGWHEALVEDVCDWLASRGVARVVVVSGADALLLKPADATPDDAAAPPARLAVVAAGGEGAAAEGRAAAAAVRGRVLVAPASATATAEGLLAAPLEEDELTAAKAAGGGRVWSARVETAALFTSQLWGAGYAPVYCRRWGLRAGGGASLPPLVCLFLFVYEGDNIGDALALAAATLKLVAPAGVGDAASGSTDSSPLTVPAYFSRLFGPPPDLSTGMYGF